MAMSFKDFIRSKKFLFHLGLLVVFIVALVYATLLFLKLYTHHGQTLTVPNLSGFSEHEVKTIVEKEKLRYQISDSVYVYDAMPGTVISQHPYPGYEVKKNRTIYLTISAVSPEKVKLPEIVDVSMREAKSRLENAGLLLGQVEYRPSEFINLVLEQRINGRPLPKDTMLNKGTPVDLVVGLGLSNERTEVPYLLGMYIDEARDTLYNLTLTLGVHIYDSSVKTAADSIAAVIWKQDPGASSDNLVELGTSIDVWLTADFQKIDEINSIDPEFDLDNEFGFDE
jgi:beta-lactam-binding protein with PASTA domain